MQERKTNCGLLHDSGVHTVSILTKMEILNIDQTEIIISDSAILERRKQESDQESELNAHLLS